MVDPAPAMAAGALLVLVGVLASKASSRLGVPALLLFLVIGMLAGSEGVGGIDFDDYELAQVVGIVALAFILFAGGFDTVWDAVRPIVGRGVLLATVGVAVTALVTGAVASWVLGISLTAGLLLGAIVSSTDAAAVFAVLRTQRVGLRERLSPLLELESGSNDPMAVFLTVAFIELVNDPGTAIVELLPLFVMQMSVGAVVGYAVAWGAVHAINRIRLEADGLYPPVLIAVVLLTFGLADVLGGSGFLAVYVAGLVMGNRSFLHRRSLMRFADGLAWLMQIAMFLVLGLLVFPSRLWPVAGQALLIAAVLIFVARPISTFVALGPLRTPVRDLLLLSWVGLRGAVPIILATFALVEDVPQAPLIFDVVFFIVLTSVVVQGTTIPVVARWLRVDAPLPRRPAYPVEPVESADGGARLHEIEVAPDSAAAGGTLVDLRLPDGVLVVLISRGDEFVVPQGATVIQGGDTLLLLADDETLPAARDLLGHS